MGYSIGIDTSNYTTSVALTDEKGNVLFDERRMLTVKKGERGLRQQEALFQHIKALPEMIENVLDANIDGSRARSGIEIVAFSARPRPIEGSYMPCFFAGEAVAKSVASALGVFCARFSHQEGHIAAIDDGENDEFLCYHLSGGTCELLEVKRRGAGYTIDIIGGSKDISFGQLFDRTGVAMGYDFPAGSELDKLAISRDINMPDGSEDIKFAPIKIDDMWFNVSGTEAQVTRLIDDLDSENESDNQISINECYEKIAKEMFDVTADCLVRLTKEARKKTGIIPVIFAGGVTQSEYIKKYINERLDKISFGARGADNAVGIALLGGRTIWR